MLTPLISQAFREKASVPSTSEQAYGPLQNQASVAHGRIQNVMSGFRKTLIKRAESICLCNGVEAVLNT